MTSNILWPSFRMLSIWENWANKPCLHLQFSFAVVIFRVIRNRVQYKHEGAGNGINKHHKYVRQEIDRSIKSIKYHSLPCNCGVHKCHIQEVYNLCTFFGGKYMYWQNTHRKHPLVPVPVHHEGRGNINALSSSCVLHAKAQGNESWMSNRVKSLQVGVRVPLNFAASTSLTRSAVYWGAWSCVTYTLRGEEMNSPVGSWVPHHRLVLPES